MTTIQIKKGLDIPISGAPKQIIEQANPVYSVGLVGRDYIWRRGTLLVKEGEHVSQGQPVVRDKKIPEIVGVAPGTGVVEMIQRGARRVLENFVIRLDKEQEEEEERPFTEEAFAKLSTEKIIAILLQTGLWASFRTRPYSTLADPGSTPQALFVNAMDSNPLAPDPAVIIADAEDDFQRGLRIIAGLYSVKVYVCKSPTSNFPTDVAANIQVANFSGPHPAGLVGTHIHYLLPVNQQRMVWHIGYQDVIAIGRYFSNSKRGMERIIALAGPAVKNPRLIRTRIGACTTDLVKEELIDGPCRVISGSILSGFQASGTNSYLGRYHSQISVLLEDRHRYMFKYLRPGSKMFSATRAFISSLLPKKIFTLTTSQNGSARAMVPIGTYEKVMPLDVLITLLLRALVVKDIETAQSLGCLELDEEDLALCTFVDPGKYDFGPILRENLLQIYKESYASTA